jgi:hypothetical protein
MSNAASFRRKTAVIRFAVPVGIVLAAAFLAACQANVPSRAKTTVKATTQSAKPAATTKPAAIAKPIGVPLSGLVQIDANYVIAAGGGNVIAAGGGNVIAAGGGNVIAAGGGNFRLLGIEVPLGTMLPVQGMQVQALDMTTGQPYGQPVLSDAKGGFKLDVPKGTTDNVLLVARFKGLEDARLVYPLVVSPEAAQDRVIDEDTATVTRYLRQCMVAFFSRQLGGTGMSGDSEAFAKGLRIPPALAAFALPALGEFRKAAEARNTMAMDMPARRLIAQRVTDTLLAKIKLTEMIIDPALYPQQDKPESAITVMTDTMRQLRVAAGQKMAGDPDYFSKQDFMKKAVQKWEIKKPSDLNEFLVGEYMANDSLTGNVFGEMHLVAENLEVPKANVERLNRAVDTIGLSLGKVFVLDKATREMALKAIATAPTE